MPHDGKDSYLGGWFSDRQETDEGADGTPLRLPGRLRRRGYFLSGLAKTRGVRIASPSCQVGEQKKKVGVGWGASGALKCTN